MDELEGWHDFLRAEKLAKYNDIRGLNLSTLERGGILGVARIVDVVSSADELPEDQRPWFFGKYGFVLADVRSCPLIPCRGMPGFFEVPADIQSRALALLS